MNLVGQTVQWVQGTTSRIAGTPGCPIHKNVTIGGWLWEATVAPVMAQRGAIKAKYTSTLANYVLEM